MSEKSSGKGPLNAPKAMVSSEALARSGSDPLARLRRIIEAWPETFEKISHGSPTWWGGRKTFATFTENHHGDDRVAVWVKADFLEQEARVEADPETYFVPPYLGPRGWVGMRLDRDPDWTEVEALLEEGYRSVAPKRAITALEAGKSETTS